ncbi:MAG TPA: glycerophosphodiester phosphodiesterase [Acidimicrobiales bacterium]|nr:glycerophosphodiester phosphodiesterase [Acidimicrobiales bacterium]
MTSIFAHRGASAAQPENTLAAFRAAVDLGADGVELDVRRTADGALAVHHDATLADGRVVVEVAAVDLPSTVPLLDAALDACGDLVVNVELKDLPGEAGHDPAHPMVPAVLRAVADARAGNRVLISSFDVTAVDRVLALDAAMPTAFLAVFGADPERGARLLDRCRRHGHRTFHPIHVGVDAELVARCAEAGIALNAWTVDDPARIAELAALGVDGVITNVPDVARRALAARRR